MSSWSLTRKRARKDSINQYSSDMSESESLPLEGLRVIDASQGIAGPSAAMMLARHGADVIKVEPPDGDWSRHRGFNSERIAGQTVANNLGKRSVAIDLKRAEGAAILKKLLTSADVFVESFRPGVIQRLGFGYDDVKSIKKDIVYISISGFGQAGPWRERGAVDVVMQAFSGLMSVNKGLQDNLPHRIGLQIIDIVTGLYAFQSVLVALYARKEHGHGCYIDCSLLQSATAFQGLPLLLHSAGARGDGTLNSSPLGTFKTADGWINLVVAKDSQWPPFCQAINRQDWAGDESLATAQKRRARRAEIASAVSEALVKETSAVWAKRLTDINVMNEPVNDHAGLLHHPQIEAIGAISWVEQPGMGKVAAINPPGAAPLKSGSRRAMAPALGADTRDVLSEIGYGAAEIDAMLASGAAVSSNAS